MLLLKEEKTIYVLVGYVTHDNVVNIAYFEDKESADVIAAVLNESILDGVSLKIFDTAGITGESEYVNDPYMSYVVDPVVMSSPPVLKWGRIYES
jgi:hypothetical protein